MTPRSTAFGLILLIVVICGAGLLLLRGSFWEEEEDLGPRTSAREGDETRDDTADDERDAAPMALSTP